MNREEKLYHELNKFFEPESVAVIGASERPGTIGRAIMVNLVGKFKGKIYPVNIKYDKVFGLPCYRSVLDIPGKVDLAVIAVPAKVVPKIIEDCGKKGVKAAIIISAGFREIGGEGEKREREVVEIAKKYGMRIIGPNCLGVYDAHSGLNTIFNPPDRQHVPQPGPVAFISQSGALGAAVLDWISIMGVGLSKFVSYGNAADVDESELIEFLTIDPKTRIITAYIEGVRDGRKFMNAIRNAVRNHKPVVILKAGKSEHGVRAVASHTGSLAGTYRVYEAAIKQAGALLIEELWEYPLILKALAWNPIPQGNRVAIVTNGGGAGVLATDAVEKQGLVMAKLDDNTIDELRKVLPPAASPHNPVDILGDAPADRYKNAIDIVSRDPNVDMIVIITIMQAPAIDMNAMRNVLKEARKNIDKPLVLVAPGGEYTEKHSKLIEREVMIPVYKSPEEAIRAIRYLYEYKKALERLR